jgi:quercetin dioxygenase-like cupin family protein
VKILKFEQGKPLSLQRHRGRNELWLFLKGGGKFICGYKTYTAKALNWFIIPKNTVHWFKGNETYVLEIQYGKVSEGDICRLP